MSVEPWLQSHISQLVSALGSSSASGYTLGVEAAGCLQDLKKWLINYDTKMNKWDVARAIANTTLVDGDLIQILAAFEAKNDIPEKIALNALEVMAHLTWPLEIDPLNPISNHLDHLLGLKSAQSRYRNAILTHSSHAVFRAVIILAIPILEKPAMDRSTRDKGIINLSISFIRNLLFIDSWDRSQVITELDNQKALEFFLFVVANLESAKPQQVLPILECLWGLVSNIDVVRLYKGRAEFSSRDRNLTDLLEKEKKLKHSRFKPTRHSRFGSMISLKTGDAALPVSGQRALANDYFGAIDNSKKWAKPRSAAATNRRRKEKIEWDHIITLTPDAQKSLREFVSKFLDSAYNPFFSKARGFCGGNTSEFTSEKITHYMYLLGWFANAERLRSSANKAAIDFKLIGVALHYNMFTMVSDTIANAHESGPLQNLDIAHAGMTCLRSIFLIIDEMTRASDEWKEAAENMLSRLFYDEIRLDLFSRIPRTAAKASLAFQAEAIELVHSMLKLLDFYASDKANLFVKSKRKSKGKDYDGSDDEGSSNSRVRERKWDLNRYIRTFYHESTIDLYQAAVVNYNETDEKVLKHCLAFFHRLFIKKGMHVLFYRVPFMIALVDATSTSGISSPDLLNGYAKFTDYYTRQLLKAFEEHPSLCTEVLFSKQRHDVSFYDQGIVGEELARKRKSKVPEFDYELKDDSLSKERKIALAVAALVEDNHKTHVEWVLETLTLLIELQQKECKLRIFCESVTKIRELNSIALMRLLLKVIGLVFDKGQYIVPASMDTFALIETCETIRKYLSEQLEVDPHNYLHRKKNEVVGDDEDGLFVGNVGASISDDDDEQEGGFNDARLQPLSAEELAAKKLTKHRATAKTQTASRKRQTMDSSDEESESDQEQGEEAAVQKAKKKAAPEKEYQSTAFVHASDDESDEERDRLFFEKELEQRRRTAERLGETAATMEPDAPLDAVPVEPTPGEESESEQELVLTTDEIELSD